MSMLLVVASLLGYSSALFIGLLVLHGLQGPWGCKYTPSVRLCLCWKAQRSRCLASLQGRGGRLIGWVTFEDQLKLCMTERAAVVVQLDARSYPMW